MLLLELGCFLLCRKCYVNKGELTGLEEKKKGNWRKRQKSREIKGAEEVDVKEHCQQSQHVNNDVNKEVAEEEEKYVKDEVDDIEEVKVVEEDDRSQRKITLKEVKESKKLKKKSMLKKSKKQKSMIKSKQSSKKLKKLWRRVQRS